MNAEFFAAYDQIVDAYVSRGLRVYGLINDEAVASAAPLGSEEFVTAYVGAATAIIEHYKDRVRVWDGGGLDATPADAGAPDAPSACACRTGGRAPSGWLLIVLIATALRVRPRL